MHENDKKNAVGYVAVWILFGGYPIGETKVENLVFYFAE